MKTVRHTRMHACHPDFSIDERRDGTIDVNWKGETVAALPAVSSLRKTYTGSCFLVGCGPSVAEVDLSVLKGRHTFGVNNSLQKFKDCALEPSFYVIGDSKRLTELPEVLDYVLSSKCVSFFPYYGLSTICQQNPALLSRANVYRVDPITRPYGVRRSNRLMFKLWAFLHSQVETRPRWLDDRKIGFSRDLSLGVFGGNNVLYMALQIAAYLGFRRIFILGMDLHSAGGRSHFYEASGPLARSDIDKNYDRQILPGFELVRDLCRKSNLEVYNLSPDSRLPDLVIPKISLESALELAEKV